MSLSDKNNKKNGSAKSYNKTETVQNSSLDDKVSENLSQNNAVKPHFFVKTDGFSKGVSENVKLGDEVKGDFYAENGAAHFYCNHSSGKPEFSVNVPKPKEQEEKHEEKLISESENTISEDKANVVPCSEGKVTSIKDLFENCSETDVKKSHKTIGDIMQHSAAPNTTRKSNYEFVSVKSVLSEHTHIKNDASLALPKQKNDSLSSKSKPHKPKKNIRNEKESNQDTDSFKKTNENNPNESGNSFKRSNDAILASLCADDIKRTNNPEKKNSKLREVFRRTIMAVLVLIIAASVLDIIFEIKSKSEADKYYTNIRDMFYSDEMVYSNPGYLAKDTESAPEERLYSDDGDIYSAPELEVLDMHTKYERMLPNLEMLRQINSNVFAWIKVEGTRVDYPVVRSPQGNNDYYLSHGLERTYSVSGAIFTDYNNSTDLSKNRNTCVYGHNMNDGTMFQTIMNFRTRNQFLNGQIEIYTAKGIYLYTPFSVYDATPTESFFKTEFANDTEYETFLSDIKSKSIFYSNISPKITDRVVTLITCTNTVLDKRFVVHGVLTEVVK